MKTKITLLLLAFLSLNSFSQRKIADKFYKEYAYIKAAEFYRKAINEGDNGVDLFAKLADCYYNNSNSKQAVYWYTLASHRKGGLTNESIYKYAQSLRSVGEYKKAETWLKKLPANDLKTLNVDHEKLKILNKDSIRIANLDINTKNSDFGPYVHNGKLYFASARDSKDGEVYSWNHEPYLDLYQAKIIEKDKKKTVESIVPVISTKINTGFHESSIAITKDGTTMYFTRNNLDEKNELEHNEEGTSHLKIFKAKLINGAWTNIEELPINSDLHSNGHPALSPDEKTLYFVSDRPSGFGQTDIYKVAILEDGTYGEPENLGKEINTKGKES